MIEVGKHDIGRSVILQTKSLNEVWVQKGRDARPAAHAFVKSQPSTAVKLKEIVPPYRAHQTGLHDWAIKAIETTFADEISHTEALIEEWRDICRRST